MKPGRLACWILAVVMAAGAAAESQRFVLEARASELDPRCRAHPEIGFLLEEKDGRPVDRQQARVDTRVPLRGELVIWLMAPNEELFEELNRLGLHVIRPHYARHWFGLCCQERPVGEHCRGNIRLEAATGEDFSDEVEIPRPDGMGERSFRLVKWLAEENPEGRWGQFLDREHGSLRWDKVILAGSSHGSTTAARFAKHQVVARVVMFAGPRDQYQSWQSLPSATPANRYFGFSHVLDAGWEADHYCRSWELLGLREYGPIVNVEESKPPFGNTRRLVTDFEVGGNAKLAHSAVVPRKGALRKADGQWGHREVWRYLFTHPVDAVGDPVPHDPDCTLDQR